MCWDTHGPSVKVCENEVPSYKNSSDYREYGNVLPQEQSLSWNRHSSNPHHEKGVKLSAVRKAIVVRIQHHSSENKNLISVPDKLEPVPVGPVEQIVWSC